MTASTTPRTAAARSRVAVAGAIAVVGALLLSGCGDMRDKPGAGDESAGAPAGANAPLFDKLPKRIQASKVIKVGSDIAYPPIEFKKGGKSVGLDLDLGAALGKELGVKLEFNNSVFDALLTGMRSKRYDIAMSAMTDTKERQEGIDPKTGKKASEGVDFIDYFSAGASLYTKKGDTKGIKGWEDLCGKKIGVQRGTVSDNFAKGESKKCEESGKDPISIEAYDNDLEAQTRLKAGGVDAVSSDFPSAVYAAATSGGGKDFEIIGDQVAANPYGIAVGKDDAQLRDALKAALEAIIKNGAYEKVLKTWGVEAGAVKEVKINGGQ
ncbi:atrA protein [Streptomyces eurocidicus]|uniref:AtrA protein n=1 Tax=Streptomyces eurocidicus TaxID=66423 RepID=A0A2N8NR43_STREU|nr:ABC transporter substrate-binding protein [Streptomyces eurocidicus]MBB5117024.1 polar amino acid transport system substrate-binding protein [Streptomyces eurocidicus]MBF6052679.1 transporter substrate-binding domain-containing protein [Streptomyces eurocidicus]PNE31236.1 atrA protein [Streptomyces eurocidicus]